MSRRSLGGLATILGLSLDNPSDSSLLSYYLKFNQNNLQKAAEHYLDDKSNNREKTQNSKIRTTSNNDNNDNDNNNKMTSDNVNKENLDVSLITKRKNKGNLLKSVNNKHQKVENTQIKQIIADIDKPDEDFTENAINSKESPSTPIKSADTNFIKNNNVTEEENPISFTKCTLTVNNSAKTSKNLLSASSSFGSAKLLDDKSIGSNHNKVSNSSKNARRQAQIQLVRTELGKILESNCCRLFPISELISILEQNEENKLEWIDFNLVEAALNELIEENLVQHSNIKDHDHSANNFFLWYQPVFMDVDYYNQRIKSVKDNPLQQQSLPETATQTLNSSILNSGKKISNQTMNTNSSPKLNQKRTSPSETSQSTVLITPVKSETKSHTPMSLQAKLLARKQAAAAALPPSTHSANKSNNNKIITPQPKIPESSTRNNDNNNNNNDTISDKHNITQKTESKNNNNNAIMDSNTIQKPASIPVELNPTQLQLIESNRLAALERRKQFQTQNLIDDLDFQLQNKKKQLSKLETEKIADVNPKQLEETAKLAEKWRLATQDILRELQTKYSERSGNNVIMSEMLKMHRIEAERLRFDEATDDFINP